MFSCRAVAETPPHRTTEKDIAGTLGWGSAKNLPRSAAVDIDTIAGQKRPPREQLIPDSKAARGKARRTDRGADLLKGSRQNIVFELAADSGMR